MADRERNCKVAKENKKIIKRNQYCFDEIMDVKFEHTLQEHQQVEVITPEMIEGYVEHAFEDGEIQYYQSEQCQISVANISSFDVDSDLVLNFANSIHPGGGYLFGANAQEETLCRQSTLYASIASKEANTMYEFNRTHRHPLESDYMLLSPCVEVFRDNYLELIHEPETVAVLTCSAPNLNGPASNLNPSEITNCMMNRIRGMIFVAAAHGYRRLTLGAWGCGAFGHDAMDVAEYFKEVLITEKMAAMFDQIVFAVYDNTPNRYNYISFDRVFRNASNLTRRNTVVANHLMPCLKMKQNKAKFDVDLGFAQGIMADGTPFIAEKCYMDGTDSTELHVIVPAVAVKSFDLDFCTKEYDEMNLKFGWSSLICRDVSERREVCDDDCVAELLNLLYDNRLVEKGEHLCCYAGAGVDKNKQEVLMLGLYLNDNEKIYTKPLISFQSFKDDSLENMEPEEDET